MNFGEDKDVWVIHSDRELEVKESLLIAKDTDDNVPIAQDYLKLFEEITKDDLTKEEKENYHNIKRAEKLVIDALKAQNSKRKIDLLTEAIKLNSRNYEYFQYRANEYYHDKDDRALEDCNKALVLNKYSYASYQVKSFIFIEKKEYKEALETINIVSKLIKHDTFLSLKGYILSETGKFDEAIESYTQALNINSNNAAHYNDRATVYRQQKTK